VTQICYWPFSNWAGFRQLCLVPTYCEAGTVKQLLRDLVFQVVKEMTVCNETAAVYNCFAESFCAVGWLHCRC